MEMTFNPKEKPENIEKLEYFVHKLRDPESFTLTWDVTNSYYTFSFDSGSHLFRSPTLCGVIDFVENWDESKGGFSERTIEDLKPDMVNHPSHYTFGKVECIDALESMTKGYNVFDGSKEGPCVFASLAWQVVKYVWRAPLKGKMLEDLKKAKFYLERLIAKVEETENAG